jgi:hypothetical protein
MRRDQLEHAIRTACQIIGRPEVIVVGSQSILGTYREDELPADATMSVEVDILPVAADNEEPRGSRTSSRVLRGSSLRSRSCTGSALTGSTWRRPRCRPGGGIAWSKVQNANTAGPSVEPHFTGWCLDKEDLCVAKLCALREKDRNFVIALLHGGLVDPAIITARLLTVEDRHRTAADRAANWLDSLQK